MGDPQPIETAHEDMIVRLDHASVSLRLTDQFHRILLASMTPNWITTEKGSPPVRPTGLCVSLT